MMNTLHRNDAVSERLGDAEAVAVALLQAVNPDAVVQAVRGHSIKEPSNLPAVQVRVSAVGVDETREGREILKIKAQVATFSELREDLPKVPVAAHINEADLSAVGYPQLREGLTSRSLSGNDGATPVAGCPALAGSGTSQLLGGAWTTWRSIEFRAIAGERVKVARVHEGYLKPSKPIMAEPAEGNRLNAGNLGWV